MNLNYNYLLAFIVAFCLTIIIAPLVIQFLKKEKIKQTILSYVDNHNIKQGTPTMGGLIFIVVICVLALIFSEGKSIFINVSVVVFFSYGLVGFLDDFLKFKFKRNLGLRAYQKIIFQLAISVIVAIFVYKSELLGGELFLPFVNKSINIGWWIIPLTAIVFLATTNSVNLIDGLDGLCSSTVIVYVLSFIALIVTFFGERLLGLSNVLLFEYKSLIVLSCIVMGALFGFLLFNCYPAKIFMGDTGSLALGAIVSCLAIFTKTTLYLPILGCAFVVTALSVIIQVAYFKLTKKRVFLMAPLHHHFERKGVHEVKIVVWYAIISLIVSAIVVLIETLC